MYKSGKVWLFAGITLVTLNMNVVTGRADESTHVEALTEPAVATLSEGNAEQQSPVTDAMDESAMSELVTEAQPIKVQAAEEQYTDEIVNQSDDEHHPLRCFAAFQIQLIYLQSSLDWLNLPLNEYLQYLHYTPLFLTNQVALIIFLAF